MVNYDISSVQDYKIIEELQYDVSAQQGSVHNFYLPLATLICEMPNIDVKVNGTTIETELLYGDNLYMYNGNKGIEEAINNSFSRTLNETVSGTLYKFFVEEDSLTITYKKAENQPLIYQTSNSTQSSINNGKTTYTINAKAGDVYVIFAINEDLNILNRKQLLQKRR